MPLISRARDSGIFDSNTSGNNWANANSILRNSVRPRDGEFVVMSFIGDLEDGDQSLFHAVPSQSSSGKTFNEYVYCPVRNNIGDSSPNLNCQYCSSTDNNIRTCRFRFHYWAFVYDHYHSQQNQYADRDGEELWEERKIGARVYYVQNVMKPQVFVVSRTGWGEVENKAQRLGQLAGYVFEYGAVYNNNRVSYSLNRAEVDVDDRRDVIRDLEGSLPSLEDIASGEIVEWDFPNYRTMDTNNNEVYDRLGGV